RKARRRPAHDAPTRALRTLDLRGAGERGPAHHPDHRLAGLVLPQNVGIAVAAIVADADDLPARSLRTAHIHLRGHGGTVHQPDLGLAVRLVLPQYVGVAI